MQNNRWSDAVINKEPVFVRGHLLEYNGEQDFVFPAGKEYRWADLQSFRFESDRIVKVDRSVEPVIVTVKTDQPRNNFSYINFQDRNVLIDINLNVGSSSATVMTNDLSHDYVHENSAYST